MVPFGFLVRKFRCNVSIILGIGVAAFGIFLQSIAGMAGSSAADIAELPADIPIVNSIKTTISNVGTIIFGILIGYEIQYFGYNATIILLACGMVIGGILWILAKKIP